MNTKSIVVIRHIVLRSNSETWPLSGDIDGCVHIFVDSHITEEINGSGLVQPCVIGNSGYSDTIDGYWEQITLGRLTD